MLRVEGIDHVALTVRDVPRSVAWYRDVLGLERQYEEVWGDFPAVVGAGTTALALFPARGPDPRPSGGVKSRGARCYVPTPCSTSAPPNVCVASISPTPSPSTLRGRGCRGS